MLALLMSSNCCFHSSCGQQLAVSLRKRVLFRYQLRLSLYILLCLLFRRLEANTETPSIAECCTQQHNNLAKQLGILICFCLRKGAITSSK